MRDVKEMLGKIFDKLDNKVDKWKTGPKQSLLRSVL
jgi:hypothetical protein